MTNDQCKNCLCRGDIDECLKTECSLHDSWMVRELRRVYENENVLLNSILDSCVRAADGENVGDFELSFPLVRRIYDLKRMED